MPAIDSGVSAMASPDDSRTVLDEGLTGDEIPAIAEAAYVFSFPMLAEYRYVYGTFLVPSLPSYRAPLNTFAGESRTLDYTFKDVISPNADTPYSSAGWIGARAEATTRHRVERR
jgi:hypothetical protein